MAIHPQLATALGIDVAFSMTDLAREPVYLLRGDHPTEPGLWTVHRMAPPPPAFAIRIDHGLVRDLPTAQDLKIRAGRQPHHDHG